MKSTYIFSSKSAALAIISVASLASCANKEEGGSTAANAVAVKEITVGDEYSGADSYGYSGTVEEDASTALSFAVAGTIRQLNVKPGDRVSKGQLIATVDPSTLRNSYDMAHAARAQAEDACQRYKQLHDKGSLPDIKWVEAQSALQEAVAAENIARKNLADCNLYAPCSGVISEKYAEPGQNVGPGIPVAKLATTGNLNVKISVPEGEIAGISVGQRANIRIEALDDKMFEGRVIEKGVIADAMSRSYAVKIRIDSPSRDLLPGMVSDVRLAKPQKPETDTGREIVIPANAIQLGDDNSYFVWVDEKGKAARRTVVCGEFRADGVVIASGLKPGDKLIVEGQQKVCTGTTVKAKR